MANITLRDPLLSFGDFNRMFEEFFPTVREERSYPPVKIVANENQLTIQFALAGYTRDDLQVEASTDCISVKGQTASDKENLFAARQFEWQRKDVSGEWDLTIADVKFENGLLTIKCPKRASLKSKLLSIR
jgi:HSP20 family molecular chaperone IbpA